MSDPSNSFNQVVQWLRTAGETTRLRLVALCAERDLSVSDLAATVGQSEPRVSRHLKILCEAHLLERLRQGQWVHYRVTRHEPAAAFVQGLLAQINHSDPVFARDRGRLMAAHTTAAAGTVPAAESRLGRALRAFVEGTVTSTTLRSSLVVGVDHLELLEATARMSGACTAIAHSRRSAQAARAYAEREDFECKVLLAPDGESLTERYLGRAGQPFGAVVLDRFRATGGELTNLLQTAKGALTPAGKLWLFERYDSLEAPRERVVEHPIARIRRLLKDAGFACERLSPIEADGEHVLAAVAAPAAQSRTTISAA
jgi:DNA-binding transcriptional ArsR family regulator